MAARKKSGRLYIRMDPQIHTRVAKTAKALGMDINGLLNLIIRSHLPEYEERAACPDKFERMRSLIELLSKVGAHRLRGDLEDVKSKLLGEALPDVVAAELATKFRDWDAVLAEWAVLRTETQSSPQPRNEPSETREQQERNEQ